MPTLSDYPHAAAQLARLEDDLKRKEEAAQRAQEEAAQRARVETEAAGDAEAARLLAAARPLYDARKAAARDLAPLLVKFWEIEARILEVEGAAWKAVNQTRRFTDNPPQARIAQQRRAVGLPDSHSVLVMPTPETPAEALAATVIAAVVGGVLVPTGPAEGAIQLAGGRGMIWDFRRQR
jgi:hypothetical protein